MALAALVTRVYQPLTGLTNARVDLMTSMVSLRAGLRGARRPGGDPGTTGRDRSRRPPGAVEFDDVAFRYPPAPTRRSPRWRQNAGPGADTDPMSTCFRVCRCGSNPARPWRWSAHPAPASRHDLADPAAVRRHAGSGAIDGHDVRDLTLDSLRRAIGVVSQDPHLFHESIGDNLRYADPDATDDEVVAACAAARIHDTIAALPDGYDTVVGERGYRLSGGEKQRLAIARLLLKNPAMMVLDEATSHLDNDNEAHDPGGARATAMETHGARDRPPAVDDPQSPTASPFVEDGRIAEIGSHDELVAKDGLYAAQLRAGELLTA